MARCLLAWSVVFVLGLAPARAQSADPPATEEKGTYLGVLFSAVPEIVYEQLPTLSRNHGVAVTHVLPDSPAAAGGLRRHDILLQYDDKKIRDPEHFARLVHDDKPERKVKFLLVRAGREETAEVTLALGPVLKIAQSSAATHQGQEEVAKATAKPADPASVNVSATPLGGGNLKVTIEYYQENSGRLRSVTCSGTPADIEKEIQRLPAKAQGLARVALDRIRALDLQQKAGEKSPPPARRQ